MDGIPAIGRARGLFEMFVPGTFLLLNLVGAAYLSPLELPSEPEGGLAWLESPVFGATVAVAFGYLLGVLLRLARANSADRWSARFIRLRRWAKWRKKGGPPIFLVEPFPYIRSLDQRSHKDWPKEAGDFFDDVWKGYTSGSGGQAFFNFCKVMVRSEDPWAAGEITSIESLSRYIAGILYALVISTASFVIVGIWQLRVGEIVVIVEILPIVYSLAIYAILRNYRFIRLKEVETVFAATFKNRDVLFCSRSRRGCGPEIGDEKQEPSEA